VFCFALKRIEEHERIKQLQGGGKELEKKPSENKEGKSSIKDGKDIPDAKEETE
jgi:hypothetical protein